MFRTAQTACVVLFATLLVACGGGGGDSTEEGNDGGGAQSQLADPNLRITGSPPGNTLEMGESHTFTVDQAGKGAITWSVTAQDGTATTTLATIGAASGRLTANGAGMVRVVASVAATGSHSADSTSYGLTISAPQPQLPAPNLRITGTPPGDTLEVGDSHTFTATQAGNGAITWSVTAQDGTATTTLATIGTGGRLTAIGAGMVRVVASVAATGTHSADSISYRLIINRNSTTLTLGVYSRSISKRDGPITLTATTNSGATITWSGSDDGAATVTDNGDNTATLTPVAPGTLMVTAMVAETATHTAASVTSDVITINDLAPPNLMISSSPPS